MDDLNLIRGEDLTDINDPKSPHYKRRFGGSAMTAIIDGLIRSGKDLGALVRFTGDVARGEADPRSPEGVDTVVRGATGMADIATTMPGGAVGALGMFAGRNARKAPLKQAHAAREILSGAGIPNPRRNFDLVDEFAPRMAQAPEGLKRQIWQETGWGLNRDKLPMFEIDDSASTFRGLPRDPSPQREDFKSVLDYIKAKERFLKDTPPEYTEFLRAKNHGTVGDILDHPELYENYPDLARLKVNWRGDLHPEHKGSYNHYTDGNATIDLNQTMGKEQAHSTLLHELQHAIQRREGWQGGANTEIGGALASRANREIEWLENLRNIRSLLDKGMTPDDIGRLAEQGKVLDGSPDVVREAMRTPPDVLEAKARMAEALKLVFPDAYSTYRRFEGETMARNVQRRQGMSPEARRGTYWRDTEDLLSPEPRFINDPNDKSGIQVVFDEGFE